jgi:outer membrane protein TolC
MVLAVAFGLFADGIVITEQAVVDAALKNNPSLISAQKMAASYESKSHKQFFLPNPMLGVEYMGVQDNGINFASSMEKNIVITQMIPFPLKYIWKTGAALSEADVYKYMYEMKRLETVNDARSAYYGLYQTVKYIEITTEAASVLKQLSNIAFAKYNQGMSSQMDVSKIDLESSLMDNDLLNLNNQKETDIQRIRLATGDSSFLTITAYSMEDPVVVELKTGFDDIKEKVLINSPLVKAALADKINAENMRNMAVADYIPDLSVQFKKRVDPGSMEYQIMFEAEIPLWFLNNQQADINEKWAMAESKDSGAQDAENRAVMEAKEHFDIIKANQRSIDMFKNKLIPQAQAALKSNLAAYQSKKIEFMALLDSERMLLDMKKEYYMRLTEYLMHYRMLEELTGGSAELGARSAE